MLHDEKVFLLDLQQIDIASSSSDLVLYLSQSVGHKCLSFLLHLILKNEKLAMIARKARNVMNCKLCNLYFVIMIVFLTPWNMKFKTKNLKMISYVQ